MKKLLVSSLILILCLSSCNALDLRKIKGNGIKIKENREITAFESLKVSAPIDVTVVSGDEYTLTIAGDENLVALIETNVSGNSLKITSSKKNIEGNVEVVVTMPSVMKSVTASSMCNVELSNRFDPESVTVSVSGMSDVDIEDIQTKYLSVTTSGMSDVSAVGYADQIKVDCSGMSKADLSKLIAKQGNCDSSGMSNITVNGENISSNASGMSSVKNVR